jgi:seryl-tRNA synthetase
MATSTTPPTTPTAPTSPSPPLLASPSTSTTVANFDTLESLQNHLKTLLIHLDDLRASHDQNASQIKELFHAGANPTTKRSIEKFKKLSREIRRFKWWIRETKRELDRVSESFEELLKLEGAEGGG